MESKERVLKNAERVDLANREVYCQSSGGNEPTTESGFCNREVTIKEREHREGLPSSNADGPDHLAMHFRINQMSKDTPFYHRGAFIHHIFCRLLTIFTEFRWAICGYPRRKFRATWQT
jgi:hypothetical protein